jgi:hypothetical protein
MTSAALGQLNILEFGVDSDLGTVLSIDVLACTGPLGIFRFLNNLNLKLIGRIFVLGWGRYQ